MQRGGDGDPSSGSLPCLRNALPAETCNACKAAEESWAEDAGSEPVDSGSLELQNQQLQELCAALQENLHAAQQRLEELVSFTDSHFSLLRECGFMLFLC